MVQTIESAAAADKAGRAVSAPPAETPAPVPGLLARWFTRISPGLKFRGFQILSRLSGIIPLRITYALAVLVGDIIYYFWHEHSQNAVSNMGRVLGPGASERAIRRAARYSFRNYCKTLADFIRFPYTSAREINRRVANPHGLEVLDQARLEGKGVLAVTAHMGNWDFAGAFISRRGVPIYSLADKFDPPELDELVTRTRLRNGVHIIKMEATAMRTLFEALRRNEAVMLLVDRPMPGEGIPVQFFGETAWLPSGPAAIALKTGAPIITGYCMRLEGDMQFTGGIEPPIAYKHLLTGNKQVDTQIISQCIATALEGLIRRAPDQWYMFRPMWPRMTTAADERRARRRARRQALRGRARHLAARSRLSRLRGRVGADAPSESLGGLATGISVDPPVIEEWVSGKGPQGG
ncbi:MAG TPA: lysophospholipid acyltransferase family protein [Chloroflexia bacterium]|nr:lysophospholipid acyltransferase family protein [Chloroflexia bacterium]